MNSSDSDLFDVYDFDAEVKRLRQERLLNPQNRVQNPFSHARVPSQHSSDDENDEDDEGMGEDEKEEDGMSLEHENDQDLDENLTHAAQRLVDMQQHMNDQLVSHSQPCGWHIDNDISPSPSPSPSPSSSSFSSLPLSPAPRHRFHESWTIFDILNVLWGDDLFAHLAQHTNMYAQHKQQQQQKQDNNWWDVTADEMRTLFGMFVYMSVVKLPSFEDYWSTQPYLSTPIIHNVMPRRRAKQLLRYLHANHSNNNNNNNSQQEARDPLYKLEPILAHLTRSFANSFQCGQKQCIDELMIAYRGRTHFIQYMPKKRVRYGIKVWCRADSDSAFISQFQIYFGKQQCTTQQQQHTTRDIVNIFTYNIMHQSCHLFFDNYFTTIDTMEQLHQNGIYATGTVRLSRAKFPKV